MDPRASRCRVPGIQTADRGGGSKKIDAGSRGGYIRPDKILDKGELEADLAKRLGLTRGRVRLARRQYLQEGDGWIKKGKKVLLTADGVIKLLGVFQIDQEDVPEVEYKDLIVVRFWTNPRLLGCIAAEDYKPAELRHYKPAEMATLVVRETKNFTKGMLVPAKKNPGETLWSLACKLPRYRGRF